MNNTERSMGLGLRALNRLAGSELLDRAGVRKPLERALFQGTRGGFRTVGAASRAFTAASRLTRPARQAPARERELFDVTPDDEQQMLREAVGAFAAEQVRPAAGAADADCATPVELLTQTGELGIGLLGVPEELGGVMAEQSAVSGVLVAEALAHGDMGIALAALAPGAVATALGLWGDAEQQARYLPAFTGESPPVAALALLEPRALFDPRTPHTRARRREGEWELSGLKSLVPRAAQAELLVIGADAEGVGPALFVVESSTKGLFVEPEPAMGLRAAGTGRVLLENARVSAGALLGDRDAYAECVQRARIAWCALAVGTAQAVLDYTVPYVNERVAFGESISNRQAVAFGVANIGIELEGMRLLTYRAASRADQGRGFAREAALARRLCAEQGARIGSEGVQLLGGHGYIKEHPVERWYRDLRAAGVMEGALLV
ncbi:MAG TPA: acyl-CoA dehydrogenase family protein [Solirubrobacteraceae bacterium]|nr:acyl-CoA dehydrogenase family protein [Solirubrobacteraceae bacterium]